MQGLPMLSLGSGATPLDTVAHIIQIALTPIFLLNGIATLLGVFSTRLARVADRAHRLRDAVDEVGEQQRVALQVELAHLHRRSIVLDIAVILAAIGGAGTCAAVLTMFLGAVSDATVAFLLFFLFGGAVMCALAAVVAYTVEMMMASIGVRAQLAADRAAAADADAAATPARPAPADVP